MILKRKKIEVQVQGAKFVFREPTTREILAFASPGERLKVIVGTLESVEGVTEEDGSAVPLERIQSLDVPRDFLAEVVEEYIKDPFFTPAVDPEKKAS